MKILVLGSNGQLGSCLFDQLKSSNHEVIYSSRKEIDLSEIPSLQKKIISIQPDLVINAAAYTAVDKAEDNPKKADLINHIAVSSIAKASNKLGCWIIHLSTDYVFDGESKCPYKENKKTNPQSIYGKSKLEGELAVKEHASKFIIIRTGWVFSEYGSNFLKTMLKIGKDNEELDVVGDQVGCPTYAQDLAKAIVNMLPIIDLDNTNSALFHFCGDQPCTWYDFAQSIFLEANNFGLKTPSLVNSIKTINYPTPATRPAYSVLECSKIKDTFGISPSNWREGIRSVVEKIKDSNDSI